jgi:hypothetical protein
MDWGKIMRNGNIPESPGREEASKMVRYRAVFREKKTGLETVEIIEAMSLHGAMRKMKSRIKALHSLVECDDQR